MELSLDPAKWRARPGMECLLGALGGDEGLTRYVGGAVRDDLLNLPVNDIDLATRLQPQQVITRLEAAGIKAVPTGIAHGTVTAVPDGHTYEVTTLRRDVATDGRRATVAFTTDWEDDAARRDFTINALFADPRSGELFDYFDGVEDLLARRVRFIGDPLTRIAEDHLRILRFFRFYARFGRGEPDAQALEACAARANDLMALSRERIADELLKLLAVADPGAAIALMIDRGILAPVLPEIRSSALPLLHRLIAAENASGIAPAAVRRLSALLPDDPRLVESIATRLKLSNKARKRLACAADRRVERSPQALAYQVGTECAVDRLLLTGRPEQARAILDWQPPRLPIGGGELIARGVPPGPVVARTLRSIEERWIGAGFPSDAEFDRIVTEALSGAA